MKHALLLTITLIVSVMLGACSSAPAAVDLAQPVCPTVVCPAVESVPESIVVAVTMPAPETLAPTATPDPCLEENIPGEVDELHRYMREFDDASSLASAAPLDALPDQISNMQRIRREAEDHFVGICLADLKAYQLSHMNVVINTLMAYMGGSEQAVVDQGIELARSYHDQYTEELAEVLGLEIQPLEIAPTPAP